MKKADKEKKRETKESSENKTTAVNVKQCLQAGRAYKRKLSTQLHERKDTDEYKYIRIAALELFLYLFVKLLLKCNNSPISDNIPVTKI